MSGNRSSALPPELHDLGWSEFFSEQLAPDETSLVPLRLAAVHRARLTGLSPRQSTPAGGRSPPLQVALVLAAHASTGDFAVGDWVLAEPGSHLLRRRLERRTLLERRTPGVRSTQLAGANIDTLFIATSCNADFNPARLERYLALANEAGTSPVVVLTKADAADDPDHYATAAAALQRDLPVVTINARHQDAARTLAPWCGAGQTVAVVGSSGVGKSTLVNTLTGAAGTPPQATGSIREQDSKGRHTTTSRSLHAIAGGGWIIDTPGMRTLHVSDVAAGLETLFAEITELAPQCKFRDCTHDREPGCAVQAAIAAGLLDPERLVRWRKLGTENRDNTSERVARGGSGRRKR